MAIQRYAVPPGGGFYVGIPGIWQGGEVLEYDDETHTVQVLESAPQADAVQDTPKATAKTAAKAATRSADLPGAEPSNADGSDVVKET